MSDAPGRRPLRIVSLNAWGGQVWGALSRWLAGLGPDVLCLQEVTRAPEPCPEWLVYADAERRLDQRTDLLRDVSAILPGHQALFAPAVRGPLHDAAGRAWPSEFGNAMWIARDLSVAGKAERVVHGAFRHDGWGAPPAPRTLQAVRLYHPTAGRFLTVGHTHGLRDPAGKGDTPARAAQARAIAAALADLARPGEGVVFGGDLNLLPGSETFAVLAAAGLSDLVTGRGHRDTRTSLYPKPVRFADYMLVNADVEVAAFDLPAAPEVSDHRPMVLDLRL
jgi:endonuclease/exonuclease/phosphatase family metal-dependent hydrolase